MRRDVTCHCCKFPVRRGVLPIIWRTDETESKKAAWCCLACWEKSAKRRMPEPFRTMHLIAEARGKKRGA